MFKYCNYKDFNCLLSKIKIKKKIIVSGAYFPNCDTISPTVTVSKYFR